MKRTLIVGCALLIIQNISLASDKELVAVGLQKQLLVDDYVIAQKENIKRELGQPNKIGVVMGPTLPTDFDPVKQFPDGLPKTGGYYEFGRRLSVVWNEKRQLFQMLYRASAENITAYAEAVDELKLKPIWQTDGSLSGLTGKTVKLRFTLQNAKLYAFEFKEGK